MRTEGIDMTDPITIDCTRSFAIGEFKLRASAGREDEAPIDEMGLNHIMRELTNAAEEEAVRLSSRASGMDLKDGEVTFASSLSMTMAGTTLIVEVTLTVDRTIADIILAMIVDDILSTVKLYMIQVLDPSGNTRVVTVFYL